MFTVDGPMTDSPLVERANPVPDHEEAAWIR
jgi:hypothetical protein